MTDIFEPPLTARVKTEWKVMYFDPINVKAGDPVTLGKTDPEWPGWQWCTNQQGKSGWVPISYIEMNDGSTGVMRDAFTAKELDIVVGEEVKLHKLESGWYWASNQKGATGWIPVRNVVVE